MQPTLRLVLLLMLLIMCTSLKKITSLSTQPFVVFDHQDIMQNLTKQEVSVSSIMLVSVLSMLERSIISSESQSLTLTFTMAMVSYLTASHSSYVIPLCLGTEEGFKDDEDLFYGSTHQRYCYPGSGPDPTPFIGDQAKSPLQRRIVDRMLTPGESSRKEFYVKWIQVLQEMELFKPELIIISAGKKAIPSHKITSLNF